jgi:hypothetical protein
MKGLKTEKYIHNEIVHNMKAADAVVPLVMELVAPKTVVDFGCGIGTWLKSFKECKIGGGGRKRFRFGWSVV